MYVSGVSLTRYSAGSTLHLFWDALISPFTRENITILIRSSVEGSVLPCRNVFAPHCSLRSDTRLMTQALSLGRKVECSPTFPCPVWHCGSDIPAGGSSAIRATLHVCTTASCGIIQGQVLLESTSPADISEVFLSK